MRRTSMLVSCMLVMAVMVFIMTAGSAKKSAYTRDFNIHCTDTLLSTGGNQFLILNPGAFWRFEGEDDLQPVVVEIVVLPETRRIRFPADGGMMTVTTRVIEEHEFINGELTQVSHRYLAACPNTGNVYTFGERVHDLENGEMVLSDESWMAGKGGARPGLCMPGYFLLGSRYHLAMAPGVSLDCAENIDSGRTVETPAGVFHNCAVVLETTPLEPDEEVLKIYAPGVGLIQDGDIQLVDYQL